MMPAMRRSTAVIAVTVAFPAAMVSVSGAGATARPVTPPATALAGSCTFSGPITPDPPITLVPKSGSHFSFAGTGACTGTLGGAAITKAPITLTFTDVETAFDTCEFGPDFNLHGVLSVPQGRAHADFPVLVSLARLAVAGPLTVTTDGGGKASGTATFAPSNAATGLTDCGTTGVATATLSGSFTTSAPLVGSLIEPAARPARKKHHKHAEHKQAKQAKRHRRVRHRR